MAQKTDRLDLKLGYKCNNFCCFCVNSKENRKLPSLSTQQVKKNLSDARKYGAKEVAFSGGEPTIRNDIVELVKFAKDCGYPTVMLITNGRMLSNPAFAKSIVNAGGNRFMISVHGTKTTHDLLTQVEHSFHQSIQGLRNVKTLGASVITDTVLNKINYKELHEIVKKLLSEGAGVCQLDFVIPSGMALTNKEKMIPKFEEISPLIHRTIDRLPKEDRNKIIVMGVPRCFMEGYESYMNEPNIPNIKISSSNREHSTNNYNQHRTKDKIKTDACNRCKHENQCEGIWKSYYELYGFSSSMKNQ